jgi:hypothetical protein
MRRDSEQRPAVSAARGTGDGVRPLAPDVIRFRSRILDAVASDLDRFHYISRDLCVAVCPCCDAPLAITFAGTAARADLVCHGGCTERDVVDAIRLRVRR